MSFGTRKSGANSTDKKLLKRYVAAGWEVDKIANKLSLTPALVKRMIAFGKKDAPAKYEDPVADEEPAKVEKPAAAKKAESK